MTPAVPFAGLAPDARALRGGGELALLDLEGAIRIGRELRRGAGADVSTATIAGALADLLNAFEHDGRSACVLVRVFVTRRFAELPPDLRAELAKRGAPEAPDSPCLRLLASRGIEPAWNDVERSAGHRALSLATGTAPMVVELARQLRLDDPTRPPATTFYVAEAAESPVVPDKTFVASYGVRSVLGFGATVWPGESFVVLAFARSVVERAVTSALEILALYARIAWGESAEGRAAGGDGTERRASMLDDLLVFQEARVRDAMIDWRRRFEQVGLEAATAAKAGAHAVEQNNKSLRRTQRAMLNVIEDLRAAREALATKVEERTRELAEANTKLEARNRELEEFVYIASHDLQEPLRTVSGYLQMIERRYGGKLGVEADEFIRFSIDGAQRMQSLIESLLLYSRVATRENTLEPLALDVALDAALSNLALRIEETSAVIERTPLPTLRADRIQMVQLFQNLLSNALKFSGPRAPRIHVTAEVVSGVHTVTVRDEGIGFNPKYVDRIFKVFRRLRRDTPGTGIGLAVCKKIAERHGGHIEAKSAPGEGATFSVVFAPAASAPQVNP